MEHSGGERNDGVFWFENRAMIVALLNADAARAVAGIEETIDGVLAREGVREYYLLSRELRTALKIFRASIRSASTPWAYSKSSVATAP